MKQRFVMAIVLMLAAGAVPRAQTQAADEEKIRAIVGTMLPEKINALDADGAAALWSETGTHAGLVYGARVREGRAAIRQMWATGFSSPGRDAARKVSVEIAGVRFIRPDVATVDAKNVYHGGANAAGILKPDTNELLFVVLTREKGAWMIQSSRVVPMIGQPR